MTRSNPLRKPTHAIPVAALSLLLLSAGMCRQAEEPPAAEATAPPAAVASEEQDRQAALDQQQRQAALEEEQRQAALAAAETQLAEREARLAAEEDRLRREQALQAERDRLAAERAATAERERQLAARERELREQEAKLAQREEQLAGEETIVIEPGPPGPLPAPTGSYEGDFDEPWRDGQEVAGAESDTPPAQAEGQEPGMTRRELVPPTKAQVSIQAGKRLEVQLLETVTSETARVGDTITTHLVEDLRNAAGTLVVPAGSEVIGRVTEASPYRRGGGPATLGVEFTAIVVSPEQRVGIRASFVEFGANRSKNRKKVAAGAVVGAILGHILGGDGSKNVIVGAAAGAAAGGAVVASAKDRDAELPAGQIIALQLEEVVTVEIEYGAVAGR